MATAGARPSVLVPLLERARLASIALQGGARGVRLEVRDAAGSSYLSLQCIAVVWVSTYGFKTASKVLFGTLLYNGAVSSEASTSVIEDKA